MEIYGDGFRLPTVAETPGGPTPTPGPTVEVLFDAEPGLDVRVLRTNRLLVEAPASPLTGGVVRVQGQPDLTFAAAGRTITRSAGSWLDDGFRPGQRIRAARSTSNDGEYLLDAVSATVLTLDAGDSLVDEGPASGVVVEARAYGEGRVGVTIRNLDANGDPIPGEEVVVAEGYTYRRAKLNVEAGLTRLVRQVIREWKRQVLPNVVNTAHTEYDPETGDGLNITALAELPAIVLDGPELAENRFYSLNGLIEVELPSGEVLLRRAAYTVDLTFPVVGVSDSTAELLNLMALATQFVDGNPYIYLDRDPTDASQGRVRYEFDFAPGGDFAITGGSNESNIRTFAGTIVVRGFDIEDIAGFADSLGVDITTAVQDVLTGVAGAVGVTLSVGQTGESFDVGPSPGGDC